MTSIPMISKNTDLNQLISQFSSSLQTLENENEHNFDDESQEDDYSDDEDKILDKYLINSNGDNITDILTSIRDELKNLNNNLSNKNVL